MIDPFKTNALNRLKRAKGQLEGIIKMIEDGKYCVDIITQVLASQGALQGIAPIILESHLNTCGANLASKDSKKKQNFIKELVKTCELTIR